MNVRDVMSKKIQIVSPDTKYRELWKIIFKTHINAVPVVDKKKKLLGIVAKEDLLHSLYHDYSEVIEDFTSVADFEIMEDKIRELSQLTAKEIMGKRVIFARETTPLMRALSRMIVRSVNQLPVVNESLTVVGMVTKGDIFYALFKQHLEK